MWIIRTITIALLVFDFDILPIPAMIISSSKLVPCEVLPNGMIALIDQSSDDQTSLHNSDNQTMCNIPIYSPVLKIGTSTLDEIFTEANTDLTNAAQSSGTSTPTTNPTTACDGVMVDLDMCLTPGQDREMADDFLPKSTETPLVRKKRKIVQDPTGRWPHNTIPYEIIENDFTIPELRNIIDAFTEYEIHTCIIFKPATAMDVNKLVIMGGHGCYSNIGMIGGTQRLVLDKGNCRKKRVIMHELGHAIGMVHEHQRWDRDDFITILRQNVRPDVLDQFRKFSQTVVDTTKVPYDYLSIMHYGGNFFSKDGVSTTIKTNNVNYQDLIGRTEQLSFIDIKAVNLMYKCNARCPTANTLACPWDGFQDKYCECRCSDGQVCQQNPQLTNLFIRPSNPFFNQILMPGIMSSQQQIIHESNLRNYPIEYPYSGHLGVSDLVMQPSPYSNFIYDRFPISNLVPNTPFIPSLMHQPTVSEQFGMQNHSLTTTSPTITAQNETFPVNPTTQSQPSPQPVGLSSKPKVTITTSPTNFTTKQPYLVTNLETVHILNIATTNKPPAPKNSLPINITAMGDIAAEANLVQKPAPIKQAPANQIPFSVTQPEMSVNHHVDLAQKSNGNTHSLLAVQTLQQTFEEKATPFRKMDRQRQNSNANYISQSSNEAHTLAKLLVNEQTNKGTFHKNPENAFQEQLKMSPLKEQLLKIKAQLRKLEDQRQQVRAQRILDPKSPRKPQLPSYQVPQDNAQMNSPQNTLQFPLRNVDLLGNTVNIRSNSFRGRNHRRFENTLVNSRRQTRIQSANIKKQASSVNGYENLQRLSDKNSVDRRNFNTASKSRRRFNNMRNSVNNEGLFQQNVNAAKNRQAPKNQPSRGAIRNDNNRFSAQSRNVASNKQTNSRSFNVQSRNSAVLGQTVNRGFSRRNRGGFRNQQNAVNNQRLNNQRLNNQRLNNVRLGGGYGSNSRSNVNAVNRQPFFNRQNPHYIIQNRERVFPSSNNRNRNIRQNQNNQRIFQNSRGFAQNSRGIAQYSMGIRQNSIGSRQNSAPAFKSFRSQQNSQASGNFRFNRQSSSRVRLGANKMQDNPMIGVNQNFRRKQQRNNTRIASPNMFNSNDGNVSPQPATDPAYFVSPFEGPVDSWL